MGSNYVTSDGKDLDSRYLGINAKAASASKADSATTATTATNVTNKGTISRNGDFVMLSPGTSGSYSCPATGIVTNTNPMGGVIVNGTNCGASTLCNAGDKLKSSTEVCLAKIKIS